MKKYSVKYQENGKIKREIVDNEKLLSLQKSKNILEIKENKRVFNFLEREIKIDNKILGQLFYELNLMLKSKINISDALEILINNRKNRKVIDFLKTINYSFSNSKPIKEELIRFKIDHSVKSFLEISQNSANIELNIEAISLLLNETKDIKKSFYKAISYPIFLLVSFIISIFIIFLFVVPNFKTIFAQTQTNLPLATKILLASEDFFLNNTAFILLIPVIVIFLIWILYKTSNKFSFFVDKFFFKTVPIVSKIYQYFEFYKLFLVIEIMQKSQYEFHRAFESSKLLVKNKYLLDKIHNIDNLLQNGKTIIYSFKYVDIFDDIVLNLLNTGEVSNSLELTIFEIKKIYKNRFDDSVNFIILLIQPIFLLLMAGLTIFIVIAIFTPIWEMGSLIR
ncbi:transformation system protein [Aliarcobacter trophiarum LMG 25534]|uniref:Transformation system protein n=1 Tax=Aliarcobacter trophiarum LMG 25534 TaxID=1032241 RepID=A0AAD0QKU5_9BACT|nr:type II secretion system F family protein [Aliarcobacter trophiarum]AXK49642.1 type II secretion/transformation system, F protein [Aliarcobacter trophiarum LMG 25534]RXI27443.1 transformation system protein [Aliarcobacter trophiarum]RXJ92311.1 transformation system protein [Aliarcobacter trophiarum LMG 25534]